MSAFTKEQMVRLCGALPCAALPAWDDLPSIPLYMDQVLILLNSYLYPDSGEVPSDRELTPSMINNYIKSRIFPASVKKKYYRHHLAALIMICVLKESVSIGDIPALLPGLGTVEGIREEYEGFLRVYRNVCQDLGASLSGVIRERAGSFSDPEELILSLSVMDNLCKSLIDSGLALKKADMLRLQDAATGSAKKRKGRPGTEAETEA